MDPVIHVPTRHGGFIVATVIGNLFGGRFADRIGSEPALRIVLVGLMLSLAVLQFTTIFHGCGLRVSEVSNCASMQMLATSFPDT